MNYQPESEQSGYIYLTGTVPGGWTLTPGSIRFAPGAYCHNVTLGELEVSEPLFDPFEKVDSKLPPIPSPSDYRPQEQIAYRIAVYHPGADYRVDGTLYYRIERESYAPLELSMPVRMAFESY